MNSIKCPQCGLVNFATAPECKRCHLKFNQPEAPAIVTPAAAETPPASTTTDSAGLSSLEPNNKLEEAKPPLAPLPEFFSDEAAPFTLGVFLFAVWLVVSVLLMGYQLQQYAKIAWSPEWKSLIHPRSQLYAPILEPLIYLEWMFKIGAILASVLLLLLMWRKSWSFLKGVRSYLLAAFAYLVLDGLAAVALRASLAKKGLATDFEPILDQLYWYPCLCVIAILVTFIWYRYFTKSERVRRIFIN